MEHRNLEKAIDIYGRLMMGEEIREGQGANGTLYEEDTKNVDVYENLDKMMKCLYLDLYKKNNT